MVQKVNKSGVTIVLTTHYMDEAEQLCDRLAIMDHGSIVEQGTHEQLLAKNGFYAGLYNSQFAGRVLAEALA